MSVYVPFDDQRKQDASFTIQSMGIQLGINIGTAALVLLGFSLLRPRNTIVYAPKLKFSTKERQPPVIESKGWFSWIKPVMKISDDILLEQIGCDALLYIRFVRLLRRLLMIMSIIGVCALIPINIVATRSTGDWPPPSGSIEILSIAGINLQNGKLRADPDLAWYWSPFAATWLFSLLIAYFMYRASCDYIDMRQYFFRLPQNEVSMKSLMISGVPVSMRSDEKLKEWILSTKTIKYPIKDTMIGHHSSKLTELFEEHEVAVKQLEITLASYLSDGKQDTDTKKRPTVRIGGFLCVGGRKVDAIEHYTKEVADLDKEIKTMRKRQSIKTSHYGWISFDRIEWAHATEQLLHKHLQIRLSPTPSDLIWSNLSLDKKTRTTKRWIGRVVYWVFVFAWMIPMTALSATSNIINLIRLIPNSEAFIDSHQVLMGVIQAYFTPIVMAIFLYLLPIFFRFLSQQQGYWTQTTLDRKVLTKLYVFFIINNLLVFTLTSMLIGIYGQLQALIASGSLPSDESISEYIMQIAKNIAEVSTFWINFVCLKSLTLTMDLAMFVPLLTITIKKFFTRPSPRELRAMAQPPEFNFSQNYNLLLFFFTIALVYSAMSPLILPFALIYFTVAGIVYKYMLMYVYVTKMETGGKIWPVLFQTVMTSVIFFQLTMIVILRLKGGLIQVYCLIPLPILTLLFQYAYYRRMHVLGSYLTGTEPTSAAVIDENFMSSDPKKKKTKKPSTLQSQFQDPAYHDKLSAPTVHDDVKHLLQKVYKQPVLGNKNKQKFNETIEMAQRYGNHVMQDMDLDKEKGFHHHKNQHNRMTLHEPGFNVQFETVTEKEIEEVDSSSSEEEDDDIIVTTQAQDTVASIVSDRSVPLHRYTTYSSHQSYGHSDADEPLLNAYQNQLSPPPPPLPPHHRNNLQMPMPRVLQHERSVTSEYIEMYSSFTPNASTANLNNYEEKTQQEDEDLDNEKIEVISLNNDIPAAVEFYGPAPERRHTAPPVITPDVPITMIRHQSLPPIHMPAYQPSLTSMVLTDDEDDDEDDARPKQAVEVRRQLSVPLNRTGSIRRSHSIKRSRTMPSRHHNAVDEGGEPVTENPFDDVPQQ